MASLVYDEFLGAALGAHWTDGSSGADPLVEVASGKLHFQCKKTEQCLIYQSVTESSFDIWIHADFGGTPADECDLQFYMEDETIFDGVIACCLAYHNVVAQGGLGFYVWAWEYSDGWGEFSEVYVPLSQNNVYLRIAGTVGGECYAYYSLTKPTSIVDWTLIPLVVDPKYSPPDTSMGFYLTGNPYFTLVATDQDWYVDFFRYAAHDHVLGPGSATEVAALIEERLEVNDSARVIESLDIIPDSRNKDEVVAVIILRE